SAEGLGEKLRNKNIQPLVQKIRRWIAALHLHARNGRSLIDLEPLRPHLRGRKVGDVLVMARYAAAAVEELLAGTLEQRHRALRSGLRVDWRRLRRGRSRRRRARDFEQIDTGGSGDFRGPVRRSLARDALDAHVGAARE